MFILDTWSLTLNIWHWYLTCYHLTPDTWHLISDTWRLTYAITWYWYTWCCDTWLDIITLDTCITLPIHDYHFYGNLTWLLYCYQTSDTPVLLNSCIPYTHVSCTVTLVARSYRRPVEHAWRRDNKDVSHDHASVWRILKGTKCYTEQSTTPHTWWGPPLESVRDTSWIVGLSSESILQEIILPPACAVWC